MRKYVLAAVGMVSLIGMSSPASALPTPPYPGQWYARMDWLHGIFEAHRPCGNHITWFCAE